MQLLNKTVTMMRSFQSTDPVQGPNCVFDQQQQQLPHPNCSLYARYGTLAVHRIMRTSCRVARSLAACNIYSIASSAGCQESQHPLMIIPGATVVAYRIHRQCVDTTDAPFYEVHQQNTSLCVAHCSSVRLSITDFFVHRSLVRKR